MSYIWYLEYLKAAKKYISSSKSISSLLFTLFLYISSILLTLLQFLYADYDDLSFGGVNMILVNVLSEYFFVLCFFEVGDFVLVWAASASLFPILLSLFTLNILFLKYTTWANQYFCVFIHLIYNFVSYSIAMRSIQNNNPIN